VQGLHRPNEGEVCESDTLAFGHHSGVGLIHSKKKKEKTFRGCGSNKLIFSLQPVQRRHSINI